MGYGGSILKYLIFNFMIIMCWAFVSWLLSIVFAIPAGQFGDVGISPAPEWETWKQWLVYGWNLTPVILFVGTTLWIIARSQEKDVNVYTYP